MLSGLLWHLHDRLQAVLHHPWVLEERTSLPSQARDLASKHEIGMLQVKPVPSREVLAPSESWPKPCGKRSSEFGRSICREIAKGLRVRDPNFSISRTSINAGEGNDQMPSDSATCQEMLQDTWVQAGCACRWLLQTGLSTKLRHQCRSWCSHPACWTMSLRFNGFSRRSASSPHRLLQAEAVLKA